MFIDVFDELTPTNVVVTVIISHEVDYFKCFNFFPVQTVKLKGDKLPFVKGNEGTIYSLRCRYVDKIFFRGTKKGSAMKNTLQGDLALREKNISIKIFKNKIQLAGITKVEQIYEAVEYILTYINKINKLVRSFKDEPEEVDRIINHIEKECKGKRSIVVNTIDYDSFMEEIEKEEYRTVYPKIHYDHRLYNYFINLLHEFKYLSDYITFLRGLIVLEKISNEKIEGLSFLYDLIYYNFKINNHLPLTSFKTFLDKNGQISSFDKADQHHILKLSIKPNVPTAKANGEEIVHTFTIYSTGNITFSAKIDYTEAGHAYNKFYDLMTRFMKKENI